MGDVEGKVGTKTITSVCSHSGVELFTIRFPTTGQTFFLHNLTTGVNATTPFYPGREVIALHLFTHIHFIGLFLPGLVQKPQLWPGLRGLLRLGIFSGQAKAIMAASTCSIFNTLSILE